ncbi:hypothetical protein BDP81DRAFT_452698 [Colletotrichum phormii]|uniref:Uncharacterized protein n=1 Tax=Colletotrichum phormii TaxID=359342 RepID=A0AAJ0EDI4_9PEZI|nr:uncharacterized protein BDP81DRAFT_452698 [Colletotrichum phormii]KAK1625743.1 hypothetical protein BDP81DRAFT_452698 [Colletotrichum phormii]
MAKEAEQSCGVGPDQAHPLPTSNSPSSQDWPHQGVPIGIEVNMKGRTIYRDCTAGEGVTQINGAYIENDPDLLNRMAMQPSGPHFNYDHIGHANSTASSYITQTLSSTDNALLYINCTKSGTGDQHNNLDATYDGDVYGTPSMHAYYFGCAVLPSQGQGQTSTGQRQINGPSLRRQKKTNAEDS